MCASSRVLVALAALCAVAGHAGPVTTPSTAPARTPGTLPSIPAQARAVEGYRLRCWQHGRLIIDEFRPGKPPEMPDRPEALLRLSNDTLVDARSATCLVRPQSRAAP
jgi:hypothetical protein